MSNDGGPAFPQLQRSETYEANDGCKVSTHESYGGMSLRDWFAGQALAGLVAATDRDGSKEVYAMDAYDLADAMLKIRGSQP